MTRVTKKAMAAAGFIGICLIATAPANAKLGLNGVSLNGTSLNGESLNGENLNGVSMNGVALNGANLNGTSFNGVVLNGNAMGPTGSALIDAVVLPSGETFDIR